MSSLRRNHAVHRPNFKKLAENLLKINDKRYRDFLNPDDDIRQLFDYSDYSKPTSRIGRDDEDQVKFVAEKLQANPALVANVRDFICKAGLQKNKDAFDNAKYYGYI
jgi:hypothetical protein